MAAALRVISVERGLDPREFALVAFGGAGPMHACSLAEELGIHTVLVPRASGVLSALGLAVSDLRHDEVRPFLAAAADSSHDELDARFEEMEVAAGEGLEGARFRRRADLRYRGQSFELTVDAEPLEGLEERFHAAHERRYGYRTEHEPVELVNLRVVATVAVDKPALREPAAEDAEEGARRRASFDGEWVDVPVLARDRLGAGSTVAGPGIVEFAESTLVVRPGWSGRIDESGTLVLSGERE